MGLTPGDISGEESTVFCSGTLSLFSDAEASVGFAVCIKKLPTVLKKMFISKDKA